MPTLDPGTSNRVRVPHQRAAGFTLIELLVVLLVLGLCAGLVHALATPDGRAQLDLESERLGALLALAATEARLTGQQVSWTSDGSAYRFHRYDEAGAARAPGADDLLRPRTLAAGIAIDELRVEGSSRRRLQLDFMPHAPARAFEMRLTRARASATISGSALGEVRTHVHAR